MPAPCVPSQQLGAVGRGRWDHAAQSPAQAPKKEESPFGLDLSPWSCCELCELCVDKRTSRWDAGRSAME